MARYEENPLAVAIIGTGLVAKQMIKVLLKLKRPITAICGRDITKSQALISEFGLEGQTLAYDSLANLWEHDDANYVYIATSNDVHTKHALDAMFHGKNVLLEKSMVQNMLQLAAIETTIKSERRIFMEANPALCSPLLKKYQESINNNEPIDGIGKIGTINISLGQVPEIDPKNRFFNPQLGGGLLNDIGSLGVAGAVMLLGRNLRVLSSDIEFNSEFNVDVRANAILVGQNGIRANLSMSFLETMPNGLVLGTNSGYVTISAFARSSISRINSLNAEPYVKDIRQEILDRYNLTGEDFLNYRDLSLALEVLEFESAVLAGFDKCYQENLTHYEESKAVARIIEEMIAHSKTDRIYPQFI